MSRARRCNALALCAALAGCRDGCRGPTPEGTPPAAPSVTSRRVSSRCVREVNGAHVATVPGAGDIASLSVACRGETLAVFALRGGSLSRVTRSRSPASRFTEPLVLGEGVDRPGPVGHDAVDGPVAWRAPTASDDDPDAFGAAMVRHVDGGFEVARGDGLAAPGLVGVGELVARRSGAGVTLTGSWGAEATPPSLRAVTVTLDGLREAPRTPAMVDLGAAGEVKAWEPLHDDVLTRDDDEGGAALTLRRPGGAVTRHALAGPWVQVHPRGVSAAGRAVFLLGEFSVGAGDGGACVPLGPGVCVRPGPVSLLVFGAEAEAPRVIALATAGVPDALAAHDADVTALWAETRAGADTATQRAARVDVRTGRVEPLTLSPPEGLGPIDAPALADCADGVWIAAEVRVPRRDGGETSAVAALPLECLVQ